MKVLEKTSKMLNELNQDKYNLFSQFLRVSSSLNEKVNMMSIKEKLHSMTKWFDLFGEEFVRVNMDEFHVIDINRRTILVMNYISVCNGILDVYTGMSRILNMVSKREPDEKSFGCFTRMRSLNGVHDNKYLKDPNDDIAYFRHVRAVFGQHPSNLEYGKGKDKKYIYSSWTFDNKHKLWDFESDLYTNICDDRDALTNSIGVKFHLVYEEITSFTQEVIKRIKYLVEELSNLIITLNFSQVKKIEGWEILSRKEQIRLLKKEIAKKYYKGEEHYYSSLVNECEELLDFDPLNGFEDETSSYIQHIDNVLLELKDAVENSRHSNITSLSDFDNCIRGAIGNTYYSEKYHMYKGGRFQYEDIFLIVLREAFQKLNMSVIENNPDYILFLVSQKKK